MLDLESLLAPLSDDAPCGSDLEYDPVFLQLQEAGAGKPEQQFGDTIIPAEPPDWRTVNEHAEDLAARTRDLRVAVWLLRCGARLQGLPGAVAGLKLVQGLLERHWDHVHPQLDASDNNDPTMRLNALAPLAMSNEGLPGEVLADLRAAGLTGARGSLTVRDLELALGADEPMGNESVPSEGGILQGVADAIAQAAELAATMRDAAESAQAIATMLNDHVGTAVAPDLGPLVRLTKVVAQAAAKAQGGTGAADADGAAGGEAASGGGGARAGVALGSIASREDAVRALERVCEWIERNEPSNPAPLFIRRAQRLMSKDFLDIIRDLVPEGMDVIEKLAGITHNE